MWINLTKQNTVFTKGFQKSFVKIDSNDKKNILKKLEKIFNWTDLPNIKKLTNYPLAEFRIKIWNYRILFIEDKILNKNLFLLITHRKNLY